MKNPTNHARPVWAAILTCAASFALAGAVSASSSSYQWEFGSAANPALPVAGAGAQATIVPGAFATGWMLNNSILGTALGVWDLGRNGTITLANPAGFAGATGQDRQLTIRVVQYSDGSIYSDLAVVAVPGATLLSSKETTGATADIGDWIIHETQWRIPAAAPGNSVQITSAYNGSLIDQVVVEGAQAAAGPQLAIRSVGPNHSQVEISWPASFSDMVLESTAGLNDQAGWTPVTDPVQVNGNVRSVTIGAVGAARLYRLKQP